MDNSKVKAVLDWPQPKSMKDVQVFLGFCNFYRRFVSFSVFAKPLTCLTAKGTTFNWHSKADSAFSTLKHLFSTAPVLKFFDYSKPAIIESDASDFAVS